MPQKKRLSDNLDDVSDFNIEDELMSKGSVPALTHEGGDHLADLPSIPQPSKDDLATPEAAQDWAQREIVRATPRAVQETVYQMRYGSKKERFEAAQKILDRGGFKGDAQKITNIAPVIVLTSEALANIPWAKKAIVDGSITKPKVIEDATITIQRGDE